MAKRNQTVNNSQLLQAALEGLQLQRDRIEEQISQVRSMLGGVARKAAPAAPAKPGGRRDLSPAARRRIAAAQKKRWAAYRKAAKGAKGAKTAKGASGQ